MTKTTMIRGRGEWARLRSNIYGFLVLLYAQEPGLELLRRLREPGFLKTFQEGSGFHLDENFLIKPEEELLQDLRLEYTRLFLGPDQHISPHESVHRQGEGLLWGKSTGEVKRFIESSGLEYPLDWEGIPDHISVEFEFMQNLTRYEADAWERKDQVDAKRSQELQKKFIQEHLIQWVPVFADMVMREARLDFYRDMAELMKAYITFEADRCRTVTEN